MQSYNYKLILAQLREAGLDNFVNELYIKDSKIYCCVALPKELQEQLKNYQLQFEKIFAQCPAISSVSVSFASEKFYPTLQAENHTAIERSSKVKYKPNFEGKPTSSVKMDSQAKAGNILAKKLNAKYVIAVASGKGGVGKSTSSANLALAFKDMGLKTGLLDLDIYGPSIPKLFELEQAKIVPQKNHNDNVREIQPIEKNGLFLMSIGFFIEENAAVIWRGHMVANFIRQILNEVAWPNLDVLVIDLPPGTGDASLSLVQQVELSGVVLVSTPHPLALIDVRRAINMFVKTKVKLLGLIENMSYFKSENSEQRHYIFGKDNVKIEAEQQNIDFLGQIPIMAHSTVLIQDMDICYKNIAIKIMQKLQDKDRGI